MGKFLSDTILDAALSELEAADQEIICAGQPATYAAATGANKLGAVAIDGTDFTKADGDTSGRKTTVAQQTGVSITASGTADHVALVDDGASALLAVTTLSSSQAVTSGNTATINSWKLEIADVS